HGHDDAAAGDDRPAVQAGVLRAGGRVVPGGGQSGALVRRRVNRIARGLSGALLSDESITQSRRMTGRITISNEANRLYHTVAREIGGGEQAVQISWALNENRKGGYWSLGFSPESYILGAYQEILDYVVAGRCREILV